MQIQQKDFKGFIKCFSVGLTTMAIGIVMLLLCNFIFNDNIKVFHPAIVVTIFSIGFFKAWYSEIRNKIECDRENRTRCPRRRKSFMW